MTVVTNMSCRIKVRVGETEIEVEGSEEFVRATIQNLTEEFIPVREKGGLVSPPTPIQYSLAEFLKKKAAKSHVDRALIFACYLLSKGEKEFNSDDIEKCYREAMEPLPANVNDVLNQLQARGLVMPAPSLKDGKKTWTVTSSGISLVKGDTNE
jgi:hypothetical protein